MAYAAAAVQQKGVARAARERALKNDQKDMTRTRSIDNLSPTQKKEKSEMQYKQQDMLEQVLLGQAAMRKQLDDRFDKLGVLIGELMVANRDKAILELGSPVPLGGPLAPRLPVVKFRPQADGTVNRAATDGGRNDAVTAFKTSVPPWDAEIRNSDVVQEILPPQPPQPVTSAQPPKNQPMVVDIMSGLSPDCAAGLPNTIEDHEDDEDDDDNEPPMIPRRVESHGSLDKEIGARYSLGHAADTREPAASFRSSGVVDAGPESPRVKPKHGKSMESMRSSIRASVPMNYTPMQEVQDKLNRAKDVFRHNFAEQLWQLLEDPTSSPQAGVYARSVPVFVVFTVFVTLLSSTDLNFLSDVTTMFLELAFESMFALEVVARLCVAPNRRRFFMNPHNIIDIVVSLPIALRAGVGFSLDQDQNPGVWFVCVCVTPVLRLLKTLRHFDTFKLLIKAFKLAAEALPALLFTLAVITLSFAAVIYAVEPRDNMPTLSRAIWLVIVTTTTVGYGDTLPESTPGTMVVSMLIICSVLYFAVPLGMVGQSFTMIWSDRDKILLIQSTRERLAEWGYQASDVPTLFRTFDTDGNGQLDLQEFARMVRQMGLQINPERQLKLFEVFDHDKSGIVDDVEFVRIMYPESYHTVYNLKKTADARALASLMGF